MEKRCLGCMNPLPEGESVCPVCGTSVEDRNPAHCLPAGTVLQEHYLVGRRLEESGDSILYLGYDQQVKDPCFIQEYYPGTLGDRQPDGTVKPLGGCDTPYGENRDAFRVLMRALGHVRDIPNMIPVYDIFEENGTVYAVSDYCEGMTLARKIKLSGGRIPWAELRPLAMSLMTTVSQLHSAGIRHLAICPDTVLVGKDGKAHLRSFSLPCVRCAGGDLETQLKAGYAAPEQYSPGDEITDATDVYGLAATVFRAATGNEPPAGNVRAANSDDLFMSAEVAQELSQPVCAALFNALQVDPENRTATVAELREQISEEPNLSALRKEAKEDREDPAPRKKSRAGWIILAAGAVALIIIGVVLAVLLSGPSKPAEEEPTSTVLPTVSTMKKTTRQEKKYAVPELVDKNYYEVRDDEINGEMTIVVRYKEYSDKAVGTILSQDPAAGASVEPGTVISVVLSCGKDESLTVPDVSGWPQEYAQKYLEALGFRVDVVLLQASDYEKGLVDSTDPVAGTVMRYGDKLTMRVSDVEAVDAGEETW